jgi:hypothetical protein
MLTAAGNQKNLAVAPVVNSVGEIAEIPVTGSKQTKSYEKTIRKDSTSINRNQM